MAPNLLPSGLYLLDLRGCIGGCLDVSTSKAEARLPHSKKIRPSRRINYGAFSLRAPIGRVCAESNRFHDLDLALLAENFEGGAAIVAPNEEVDGGVGELEIFDL